MQKPIFSASPTKSGGILGGFSRGRLRNGVEADSGRREVGGAQLRRVLSAEIIQSCTEEKSSPFALASATRHAIGFYTLYRHYFEHA